MKRGIFTLLFTIFLSTSYSFAQQQNVQIVPSPTKSYTGTMRILNAIEIRVLMPLNYEPRPELQKTHRLANRPGIEETRVYARTFAGQERRIGLAILRSVSGGFDFVITAEKDANGNTASTQDLFQINRQLQQLVTTQQTNTEPDLAQEMVRLGHIEAQMALDLLKALGYETMSLNNTQRSTFSQQPGSRPPQQTSPMSQNRMSPNRSMTSGTANISQMASNKKLPLVIHVGNASKTSLMQSPASPSRGGTGQTARSGGRGLSGGAPALGGTHLHSATASAPEERLLVVYDRNDPESFEKLLNTLQTQIDVAAQQIVIEALVLELNSGALRDLGVEYSGGKGHVEGSFERSQTGIDLPFTFLFSRDGLSDFFSFKGKLEALTESGQAEVLSSPSVLVLNDRQARIQVGQQVPVVHSTTTAASTSRSVEYFPIGIVLNLRPRISPDGTEVAMQIETIISSISDASPQNVGSGSQVVFAPVVDNRTVETYVRVANGTPFIIGGLLSTEKRNRRVGLPILSNIPLLGRAFSRESTERDSREVIVVLTPHIVPLDDPNFSYLIPKDSDRFDRFDTQLFRNAYRVRDDDVWDLAFIRQSPALASLVTRLSKRVQQDLTLRRREPFQSILNGKMPGEEVLVRRMIYEIVDRLNYPEEIDDDKIFYFAKPASSKRDQRFEDLYLSVATQATLSDPNKATILTFDAQSEPDVHQTFNLPLAQVRDTTVTDLEHLLWDINRFDDQGNQTQYGIAISSPDDLRRLRQVLILKQVLELNKDQPPLTLEAFRPGVQILFPSRKNMQERYHLIDRKVAQMFYETEFYYQASERVFNRTVKEIDQLLGASK